MERVRHRERIGASMVRARVNLVPDEGACLANDAPAGWRCFGSSLTMRDSGSGAKWPDAPSRDALWYVGKGEVRIGASWAASEQDG